MNTDSVLSLNDLHNWKFDGTPLAVIGHPIKHSLSPHIHNAAFQASELPDWRYFKFDIPKTDFAQALPLFHQHNFQGLSLTHPHKIHVLDLLDSIDASARQIGAVNTLLHTPNGYRGFNTDGPGMEAAILHDLDLPLKGQTVIILGAGGAAKAAATQCLFSNCKHLWIGNRNPDRLKSLLNDLKNIPHSSQITPFDLTFPPHTLPASGLLINATSLGLDPSDPAPIDLNRFDPSLNVFDMIYNPPQTTLIRDALKLGMPATNGLRMLVEQAAIAFKIWTQKDAPVDTMWQAAQSASNSTD